MRVERKSGRTGAARDDWIRRGDPSHRAAGVAGDERAGGQAGRRVDCGLCEDAMGRWLSRAGDCSEGAVGVEYRVCVCAKWWRPP